MPLPLLGFTRGTFSRRDQHCRFTGNLLLIPNCILLCLALIFVVIIPSILKEPLPQGDSLLPDRVGKWRNLLRRRFGRLTQENDQAIHEALDPISEACNTESVKHNEHVNRVLVTGSAGFIGFHVAATLVNRGDYVVGYDNFNNYYPIVLKNERSEFLQKTAGVYTIKGDLNDTQLLTDILNRCEITHVVHMAAQAGVRYAKERPMTYVDSNVYGTVSLFEAARLAEIPPQIIYASSSSVYGSNAKSPFSEDDAVDNPTSLYGSTKRSVELTAVVYHRLFHLSLTGLRFFTVYGPWGRPDMACFQFAKSILQQKKITIFRAANGEELGRDFTYVDDIVAGIVGAMNTSTNSTAALATNRIFNLGNTHPVTVTEFVRKLEKAIGMKTDVEYKIIENSGDVLFTHANVSRAHQAFDFTPQVSLDEGLKRFSVWFLDYSKGMSPELWSYQGS